MTARRLVRLANAASGAAHTEYRTPYTSPSSPTCASVSRNSAFIGAARIARTWRSIVLKAAMAVRNARLMAGRPAKPASERPEARGRVSFTDMPLISLTRGIGPQYENGRESCRERGGQYV